MTNYNQLWFESMWTNRENSIVRELWKKEFKMSVETFQFILDLVGRNLSRVDTKFRKAVAVEKRLAITIWRLATGNSYRSISKVFGIGKSTTIKIFQDGVNEICALAPTFIKFPNMMLETALAIKSFVEFTDSAIPQVLGAIDGTHIQILAPASDSKVDYFSRKQVYTINTQAVVGSNLLFLDVSTGFPGSIHDARMLRSSSLFTKSEANEILIKPEKVIEGVRFRPLLIGDGAYPHTSWLVKPYPNNIRLTETQKKFNKSLWSVRVSVERAFGLLKGRWRCLLKRLDNEIEYSTSVIMSCFVLHNIMQVRGEKYIDFDGLIDSIIHDERISRQRRAQYPQAIGNWQDTLADYVSNI